MLDKKLLSSALQLCRMVSVVAFLPSFCWSDSSLAPVCCALCDSQDTKGQCPIHCCVCWTTALTASWIHISPAKAFCWCKWQTSLTLRDCYFYPCPWHSLAVAAPFLHLLDGQCICPIQSQCLCKFTDSIPIIKPLRCTNFSNLFLKWNSTCFRQVFCPPSGV
jgi:hypothetical protein